MSWPAVPMLLSTLVTLVPALTSVRAPVAAVVSWLTLTASVSAVPAVTPEILPLPSALMVTLPNLGESAICSWIVPVAGSVTVFRLVPL